MTRCRIKYIFFDILCVYVVIHQAHSPPVFHLMMQLLKFRFLELQNNLLKEHSLEFFTYFVPTYYFHWVH